METGLVGIKAQHKKVKKRKKDRKHREAERAHERLRIYDLVMPLTLHSLV